MTIVLVALDRIERRSQQGDGTAVGPTPGQRIVQSFSHHYWVFIEETVSDLQTQFCLGRLRIISRTSPHTTNTGGFGETSSRDVAVLNQQVHAADGPPRQYVATYLDPRSGDALLNVIRTLFD